MSDSTVLALPGFEIVILVASLLAIAAVIFVVIVAVRGKLRPGRVVIAVIIALFVPFVGAVLVVWATVIEARRTDTMAGTATTGGISSQR